VRRFNVANPLLRVLRPPHDNSSSDDEDDEAGAHTRPLFGST
jgi:hypothetical protein